MCSASASFTATATEESLREHQACMGQALVLKLECGAQASVRCSSFSGKSGRGKREGCLPANWASGNNSRKKV
eukprot:scaffold137753_cov19-Tisochrysis_lutea.AAC.2